MAGRVRAAGSVVPNAPGSDANWWTWSASGSGQGGSSADAWATTTSLGTLHWLFAIPDSDGNASQLAALDRLTIILLLQGGICLRMPELTAGTRGSLAGGGSVPSAVDGSGDWLSWSMPGASQAQVQNSPGGGFQAPPATFNGQIWVSNSATNSAKFTIADSFGLILEVGGHITAYFSGALETPGS